MHLGHRFLVAVLSLLVGAVVLAAPASAATTPTAMALGAAARPAGATSVLGIDVRTTAGDPVPGVPVSVERRSRGTWRPVATLTTDAAGHAELAARVARTAADNAFRASYAGDATYAPATVTGALPIARRESRVRVTGPRKVVDGRRVALQVRWRAGNGDPVAGRVVLQRRVPGERRWRRAAVVRTDAEGRATLRVRPRVDTVWRARVAANDWVRGATSRPLRIDNRPPGRPVVLPRGAPEPRVRLPRQRRAVGKGPHAVVTPIPNGVWNDMRGRSWRAGCPVGRSGLRLVRVNYWGYDGYRYRGEVVAATGAAASMAGALAEMHRRGFPIRSMYRVDRFGWSARLQGADDYRSMAAGNTSAFNCRWVVGRPGVRSPHSYGRSLDINPWENPYHSSHGVVPNGWWPGRSHPQVAWRSRGHAVVRLMARHGLRWTYGTHDAHHFDAVGSARAAARTDLSPRVLHPQCGGLVCK